MNNDRYLYHYFILPAADWPARGLFLGYGRRGRYLCLHGWYQRGLESGAHYWLPVH